MPVNAQSGEIKYRYPVDNQKITNKITKTFVFGQVTPPDMPFKINGEKIDVHTNGGFIAYLPVDTESDSFVFKGELEDGTVKELKIRLNKPSQEEKKDPWIQINSNSSDITIMPGDPVHIKASGTPGKEAFFSIEGLVKDAPLTEYPEGSGQYFGVYWSKPTDAVQSKDIRVKFKTGIFRSGVNSTANGKLTVMPSPVLLETSSDNAVVRGTISGGYMLFLDKGVKLISTGRAGNMHRIQLSPNETGWIENSKVQECEQKIAPIPPFTETGNINLASTKYGTDVLITMYDKVPYQIEETEFGLRVKMYYTSLHTNWTVYDSSDTFVRNVTFRQSAENVAEVDVFTSEPIWGYYVSYAGNAMKLQIRKQPVILKYWPKPLAGLNVVIDPGHSPRRVPPYDGTVGPLGTFEYESNMYISQKLKARLEEYGANVIMTRTGDENVPLADRPKIARERGGDLFISVHNNALGDGQNPLRPELGYQVYYYHQHSRALGQAIHGEYRKNVPLPDQGLRFGDYLVARQTWMPAVLTETAYLILPKQEEKLNDPEFQELAAKAMADGVLKFMSVQPEPPKTVYKKKTPSNNKLQSELQEKTKNASAYSKGRR
ncbi:MAG: N-acetylmuramoyl-L-alanine amidase [Elusimicrobiales bacterium]|nr:N-acetylmuramoyl-L-alanine amidase [Elusimicrobiales bacterium]